MDSSPYQSPNRRRKRQQRKACDLCRRRKVRCDIDEQPAGSCSVCEKSGLVCRSTTQWAKPNRPSTHARRSGRRSSTEGLEKGRGTQPTTGTATTSPSSTASLPSQPSAGREDFARSGLSRFFRHGINAGAWVVFDSLNYMRIAYVGTAVSNLVHLVQLHRASRQSPPPLANLAGIANNPVLEDISIHSDDATSKVVHYPYPPIRPKNGWKPGPEVWSGITTTDLASDVSSFPAQEVRDALVAAYFEHVHPFHPVISMPEFMASYRSSDRPPPLLLFQAVLMAGAHACSHPLVASARHAVKTTLFRRASMLFHMRHETDRAFLMQAAVLFTRHVGDGDTVTGGPWYWSGIAVRIGCGLGMHRQSPTLPPKETSQYRRCWWSAFICEVFSSLENGRPCAVRAENIDQLTLSAEDMTDTPGQQPPSNAGGLRPDFIIRMVELAYIGLDILTLNEPTQNRIIDLHSINTRLCQWSLNSAIPSSARDDNDNNSDTEDSWTCQLHMHYNLLLLHLHRNFPNEPSSQSVCSTAAQSIIRALETLVSHNALAQCHFTSVSAVTAAGIQLANEIRAAIAAQAFLVAIHALERLGRLLHPARLLAGYWPNAEAVHSVFHEIYQEYKSYVAQGLQGEAVIVPEIQPDWYRLLAGAQPPQPAPGGREWLSIDVNWTELL
ncbi:transcription factor domain-containing protein [Aspergillus lucknowensis]|uniref:Fungal-specific transcription factor domain-containing protein n=1 Tax=Aspergillus lucknowensis TaxID=176173 RepID=A0ABR4LS79_9EURO